MSYDDIDYLQKKQEELTSLLKLLNQKCSEFLDKPDKLDDLQKAEAERTATKIALDDVEQKLKALDNREHQIEETAEKHNIGRLGFDTAKALVDVANAYFSGGHDPNELMTKMLLAQNQPGVEQALTQQQQILTNPDKDALSFKQVEEIFNEAKREEHKNVIEALNDSKEIDKKELPDIAQKWEKDIAEKEKAINEDFNKHIKTLEKSKAEQDIYLDDLKKIPDKEIREEKVEHLQSSIKAKMDDGRKDAENERNKRMDEVNIEKEVLRSAIGESTKQLPDIDARNEEIEKRRIEFERQQQERKR